MITYKLLGRNGNMGNALFQYSTLLSVGKDNGYTVKIPNNPSHYDDYCQAMNFNLSQGFNIKTPCFTKEESDSITNQYQDPAFHFTKNVFNIPDNTDLTGYFQSEKYFNHNREYILEHLQFKETIVALSDEIFIEAGIDPEETTSIHVRRGDYVKKQAWHPLMTPEYYFNATKLIPSKNYLVFSDDIAWCKEAFGLNKKVKYSNSKNPFADMHAMSSCKNNIIANSTFSWWSAWFNTNPDKVIIAPKNWFGPMYKDWNTADLIPESWTRV